MYLPPHFTQDDEAAIAGLLERHPLATLVWTGADGFEAEHLPLLWDRAPADGPRGTLRGHVARANPVWREAVGQSVLAVFNGPQAYVTPSWYPSKAENAKVVPTWNYAVVHVRGPLRVIDDAGWLRTLVGRLTGTHEAPFAHRWQVSDAPADFIDQMLRAIVGIEVEVTQLQAKWKVSQNRSAADRGGVAAGLSSRPGDDAKALAALVPRG